MFTSLVIHVERGQNLVAVSPPSLLLAAADRDAIVRLSVPASSATGPGDGYLVYNSDKQHTHSLQPHSFPATSASIGQISQMTDR